LAANCDAGVMFRTKLYQRTPGEGVETLKIVGAFDEAGESEILVTHTVDGAVVDERIGFYGHGGEQWMLDRHTSWTADGFELVSSGPDF
jgi:hypothetical protein